MAEDISNKMLAALLVTAIVVSIGGTYVVLQQAPVVTGMFTGTDANGTISFTSQGVLSIRLLDALTTFGNVTFNAAGPCVIDTLGVQTACTSTLSNDVMVLENDGNVNANVVVNSTKDKDGNFPLGTGGGQKFKAVEANSDDCADAGTLATAYATLPGAGGIRANVCSILNYTDGNDDLTIHYELTIGSDLAPGNYTENVTFWASLA